jgi:CHAD domain-containing protein
MPKPWLNKDLTPDLPLSHAAAMILRVKLPELLHYQRAAAAGTVAGVHDMRIAAKRWREAVRVLRPALPKDARRKLLPVVEELNDALGQVRDRDVLRQAFKQMAAEAPALPDLRPIRRELARQRRQKHQKLQKLLKRLERSDFAHRYEQLMEALAGQPPQGQPPVAQFAAAAIGLRLQDVMDSAHDITGRYDSVRFHRERIRVKKLKYALEPFLPLLPTDCPDLYPAVSGLQELMGEVHDVDVQGEVIADWIAAEGLVEGLEVLRFIARRRRALLRQTRQHFRQMVEEDFEGRLQCILTELTQPRSVIAPT